MQVYRKVDPHWFAFLGGGFFYGIVCVCFSVECGLKCVFWICVILFSQLLSADIFCFIIGQMQKKLQNLKASKKQQLQATKLSVEGRGMVKYL